MVGSPVRVMHTVESASADGGLHVSCHHVDSLSASGSCFSSAAMVLLLRFHQQQQLLQLSMHYLAFHVRKSSAAQCKQKDDVPKATLSWFLYALLMSIAQESVQCCGPIAVWHNSRLYMRLRHGLACMLQAGQ